MTAPLILALLLAAGPHPQATDAAGPAPAGPAAGLAASAAEPVPAAAAPRAAPRQIEDDHRPARARRAPGKAVRRLVRKREILPSACGRRPAESPDPSVPALAAEADRAASAVARADRAGPWCIPTSLRLLAAGKAATRLHLPPPTHLL